MILLSLLLTFSSPQTSTAAVAVRARVAQTCIVATAGVICRGAAERPGQVRIVREGGSGESYSGPATRPRTERPRITYGGYITVVEF